MTDPFGEAARAAVRALSREQFEALAARLAGGGSVAGVLDAVALPAYRDMATQVMAAVTTTGVDRAVAAHLRALAEGYALGRAAQRVEVVWNGPTSSAVPVRASARVLADLVREARRDLVLMSCSARPYQPLTEALAWRVGLPWSPSSRLSPGPVALCLARSLLPRFWQFPVCRCGTGRQVGGPSSIQDARQAGGC